MTEFLQSLDLDVTRLRTIVDKFRKVWYNQLVKKRKETKTMTFIKDFEITEEIHGSETFEVLIIYHYDGRIQKFYLMHE